MPFTIGLNWEVLPINNEIMKALEFVVREIREDRPFVHEIQVAPSEIDLEIADAQFAGPVHSHIQLLRSNQNVYVKGEFLASVVVECRRCIEPLEAEITSEIGLYFCHSEKPGSVDPGLIEAGERYYSGDTIDLCEDVRQSLVLEIPIWSLCIESCKGLCPKCGENLNIAECNCSESEAPSSPFSALADLLEKSERSQNDSESI